MQDVDAKQKHADAELSRLGAEQETALSNFIAPREHCDSSKLVRTNTSKQRRKLAARQKTGEARLSRARAQLVRAQQHLRSARERNDALEQDVQQRIDRMAQTKATLAQVERLIAGVQADLRKNARQEEALLRNWEALESESMKYFGPSHRPNSSPPGPRGKVREKGY